jgi:hypothetical protein
VQQIAQVLGEVPDGGDSELNAEMCGIRIRDRNLQYGFAATIELAQKGFTVANSQKSERFSAERFIWGWLGRELLVALT